MRFGGIQIMPGVSLCFIQNNYVWTHYTNYVWTHYTAIHTIQHYLLKTRTRRTCYFALDTSHKTCKRDSYNSKEICKRDVPTIHTQNITIYKKLAPGVLVASFDMSNKTYKSKSYTFKRHLQKRLAENRYTKHVLRIVCTRWHALIIGLFCRRALYTR